MIIYSYMNMSMGKSVKILQYLQDLSVYQPHVSTCISWTPRKYIERILASVQLSCSIWQPATKIRLQDTSCKGQKGTAHPQAPWLQARLHCDLSCMWTLVQLLGTKYPDDDNFRVYKVWKKGKHTSTLACIILYLTVCVPKASCP